MIQISGEQREHTITYTDGSKRIARLFQLKDGTVCEMKPRSKRYGTILSLDFVTDIRPVQKRALTPAMKARKFLTKVCTYLEKSGLWANVLHDFRILAAADDEALNQLMAHNLSWDEETKICQGLGMERRYGGIDSLIGSVEKGIKTINYEKWNKELVIKEFAEAIKNKQSYNRQWRKGYDNSISCRMYNGQMVAHYNEEYKNCGNGHYYLAIDERHAIFCEDD